MTFEEFMEKYAPSLWRDNYMFKQDLLSIAGQGYSINAAQGLVDALRENKYEDIALKILSRYNKT